MEIKDNRIDAGKAFDWGKTSEYYARYRDIYPDISLSCLLSVLINYIKTNVFTVRYGIFYVFCMNNP